MAEGASGTLPSREPREIHVVWDEHGNPAMYGAKPFISVYGGSVPMVEKSELTKAVQQRDKLLAALKALLAKHIEVCEQEFCTGPHNKGWGEDEEPIRSALAAIAACEEDAP